MPGVLSQTHDPYGANSLRKLNVSWSGTVVTLIDPAPLAGTG